MGASVAVERGAGTAAGVTVDMTIDTLARLAGMTTRTVRSYRTLGLLPAPRLVGRVGWYDGGHLTRLGHIGRLVRRGYPLAVIRELLSASEAGRSVEDLFASD
jgi:DNA-binding transcriptional MerR regulator